MSIIHNFEQKNESIIVYFIPSYSAFIIVQQFTLNTSDNDIRYYFTSTSLFQNDMTLNQIAVTNCDIE